MQVDINQVQTCGNDSDSSEDDHVVMFANMAKTVVAPMQRWATLNVRSRLAVRTKLLVQANSKGGATAPRPAPTAQGREQAERARTDSAAAPPEAGQLAATGSTPSVGAAAPDTIAAAQVQARTDSPHAGAGQSRGGEGSRTAAPMRGPIGEAAQGEEGARDTPVVWDTHSSYFPDPLRHPDDAVRAAQQGGAGNEQSALLGGSGGGSVGQHAQGFGGRNFSTPELEGGEANRAAGAPDGNVTLAAGGVLQSGLQAGAPGSASGSDALEDGEERDMALRIMGSAWDSSAWLFFNSCTMAVIFGCWAHARKSWVQLLLLTANQSVHVAFMVAVLPCCDVGWSSILVNVEELLLLGTAFGLMGDSALPALQTAFVLMYPLIVFTMFAGDAFVGLLKLFKKCHSYSVQLPAAAA